MIKKLVNTFHFLICVVLMIQLVGCGTILYPERKGQKAGRIDMGVAILDGIGLLFFLIPGVIAFAVDFNNGTIYLPGTARGSLDIKNIKQVKFDPKHSSVASVEKMIKDQTGYSIKLDQSNMRITKLKSNEDIDEQFSLALPEIQDNRMVLMR